MNPKIDRILVNYNNSSDTVKCIDSLLKTIAFSFRNIVIVDNSDKDKSLPETFLEKYPQINLYPRFSYLA